MTTQIAKKISMKVLVGTVGAFIPMKEETYEKDGKTLTKEVYANGETVWVAEVIGLARGTKTGTSNYGEWTALMGDFYARPLVGDKADKVDDKGEVTETGTRYRTGQLFLPDVALNLIVPVVDTLDKGAAVEVAFKIGITANEESNFGYDYTAAFLVEPEENDPLSMLAAKVAPKLEDKKTAKK